MEWKKNFLADAFDEEPVVDEFGIVRCEIRETYSYEFHKKFTKGAHLRKLADEKYHQIQWETPFYKDILSSYLSETDLGSGMLLDFGCGDGRFTEMLVEKGGRRIVCVDFDYATLVSLAEYAEQEGFREHLLIVHSDFESFPFGNEVFSLILGIGVLYYLNDNYEGALHTLHQSLKSDGIMVTSDPSLEGFFLRTLIFDSFERAMSVWARRKFKETKDETGYEFRVFGLDEWPEIFRTAGFKVCDYRGVSLFHNLLRVSLLRGEVSESEIDKYEEELTAFFEYLHQHGGLHKHYMWKLQKGI